MQKRNIIKETIRLAKAAEILKDYGYELDIVEFVKICVLMNMPSKILCREDCKGLCPKCGANLNIAECGCDRAVLDPRMSIIRDLFRQQGSLSDDKS